MQEDNGKSSKWKKSETDISKTRTFEVFIN